MKILLLSATRLEIQPILDKSVPPGIELLIGGVGIPSTIYQLTQQLNKNHYDLVIQAGIAGCFDTSFALGETVLIKKDRFADIGVNEKNGWSDIYAMGLADENEIPFQKGWLVNEHAFLNTTSLKKAAAITVNTITDNSLQNEMMYKRYNAVVESMEGAALHYVCLQQQIPFLQLRSVSNYIGERDKTKWKMKEAIVNLNNELEKLINNYTN